MKRRRILTVPMAELLKGDLITLSYSHTDEPHIEERVLESRSSMDGDMDWYIKTDGDHYTSFGDPWRQFTLILEVD